MKENLVQKRYLAIVKGILENDHGTIDLPIGRPDPENVARGVMEGGAPSVTHYTVRERFLQSGYTPVSYTHLDVYKRQVPFLYRLRP